MKKYESELSITLQKCENKKGIFLGDKMNPKKESSTTFSILQVVSSVQNKKDITPEISSDIFRRKTFLNNQILSNRFGIEEASINDVTRYCRVTIADLRKIGFKSACKLIDEDGNFNIEIETDNYGSISLITFPYTESNVGVFMNKEGDMSFVADGRCVVIDNKLYLLSTNQTSIQKFVKEKEANPESRISLSRIISREIWQIQEDDSFGNDNIIKAVMWLGYTKYCDFPKYGKNEFYNTIWSVDKDQNLKDLCESNQSLMKYINYSSLSQTGISGVCGPLKEGLKRYKQTVLDKHGNPKLDKEGNQVFETYWLLEAGEVTPFKGTKGKLDITANQGNKKYKQSYYQGRSLVLLAEIKPNGSKYAVNLSGNCIATKTAAESYLSDMTREKANECGMKDIPAHKIFVCCNGKPVRIKGATHTMDMIATCPDGTIENNIVILPPREFNPDGTIDTDTSKFKHLCAYRDNQSKLGLYELEYEDKKITVPGLYCHIYEDAMHSAVTSIKVDVQNIAYYGAIMLEYTLNGKTNLRKAFAKMIDHKKILRAMNLVRFGRGELEETSLEDFMNNL